ncbi:MAG: thioredoxin domain-containing protein [Acidobacteria bacterium]|nr:thioredoxin domain-containing protein [Acidobacteriota bacterium]MBV9478651.1 thioredoxin domain-containing protein [Acidobacteriota bacterium]
MKRALLGIAILVLPYSAHAQQKMDAATLRNYAAKALPRCPGGILTLDPIATGPRNFTAYTATLRSSDQYCGQQKYLLFSPSTQQIIIGSVIELPADGRPAAARVTQKGSELLGKQVTATVAPFPLPDGLKAVTISRETPNGSFGYHGFIDASEQYLIVGMRGNLNTDPAKTLRDTLGTGTAVRRGNAKSPLEIIELSDFECPTCGRAHGLVEPIIRKSLDKINYARLDLPLFEMHEWALSAAMGARAIQRVAPAKYWDYVDYVFKNQETIGKQQIDKFVQNYCEDHDIDWNAAQKIYTSKTERQALLDQVSRAFAIGVASTPTYIVNGQILGFGPEGAFTIEQIKNAIAATPDTPAKASTKPAAKPPVKSTKKPK